MTTTADVRAPEATPRRKIFPHDRWMEAQGIPIHRGYYIEDLRTLELGHWAARECNAAFVQLTGLEGVSEVRVTEVPAGATLPPTRLPVDEVVYVLQGNGLTSVWADESAKPTFEWQPRSMFLVPRNAWHQYSNARGDRPVKLMHYNYLPIVMSGLPDILDQRGGQAALSTDMYAEAKEFEDDQYAFGGRRTYWFGNFFPDMQAWDRLKEYQERGAGGRTVYMQFPDSEMSCHMSVFPSRTYKKAHRHGPGRAIVIPGGEGYSILWEEGKEKIVVPWREASLFTPPNKWFHQHFNVGAIPARYLALHPLPQFSGHAEKVEDRARDQIEYPDEDLWVREKFEGELAKQNITSLMPGEAYNDHDYVWAYNKPL